jgi:glycosyltransferase involved in cell wall biosynthesis
MNILVLGPSDMVHLRRLVRALADRGHRVHVISMGPDRVPGATFERFRIPPLGSRYLRGWRRRWEKQASEWLCRFDVVNVHFLSDWGFTEDTPHHGRLVVKAYGSDVDPPPDTPTPEPVILEARRALLRRADTAVVSGRWFRLKVADFAGLSPERVTVVPNGVDLRLFKPQERPKRSYPTVGFVKGFQPVYGPMDLMEAAGHVLRRRPDVRFELVGAGPLRVACQQRAVELGIDHAIRWVGRRPQEALPRLMAAWDLVAIPSRKESFCVSALEAAAMQLPVVGTRVGGLPETVVDGRTGLLVEPDSPPVLAGAILELLADGERRRSMGIEGRRRVVEHFDWERCVDRWLTRLEGVPAAAMC